MSLRWPITIAACFLSAAFAWFAQVQYEKDPAQAIGMLLGAAIIPGLIVGILAARVPASRRNNFLDYRWAILAFAIWTTLSWVGAKSLREHSDTAPPRPAMLSDGSLAAEVSQPESAGAAIEKPFGESTVGDWRVTRLSPPNVGCHAAIYPGSSLLGIGFALQKKSGILQIGDDQWTAVQDGAAYQLTVRFDDRRRWLLDAKGFRIGDGPALMAAFFNDPAFMAEFMSSREMTVRFEDHDVASFDIKDGAAVVREIIRCQGGANPLSR